MAGNTVTILANVDLRGSLHLKNFDALPPTAEVGTVISHNGVLYAYEDLEGVQMWYPLTQASRAYLHTQGAAALEWTVNHGLESTQVWFAVQDEQGHPVYPQKEPIDANSFKLVFTEASVGTCVCVAPGDLIVPRISVDTLNAVTLESTYLNVGGGRFTVSADGPFWWDDPLITGPQADLKIQNALTTGNYIKPGEDGKIAANLLPALAITDTFPVALKEDLYTLTAERGDVGIVMTGEGQGSYILMGDNPAISNNWTRLATPLNVAESLANPVVLNFSGDVEGSITFQEGGSHAGDLTVIGDTVQNITGNGPTPINFENGYYAAVNVTGACTLTFSGIRNDGKAYGITLEFTNGGTNVTWPASVTWLDKAPTLKAAGKSMVTLVTRDGGASWLGQ